MQSLRELAKTAGVSHVSVLNAKKRLGITSENLSEEEAAMVLEEVNKTKDLKEETSKKEKVKSGNFKPTVRRIDESEESSVLDMLQDCKEQYVRNEGLIQRLQYEIDHQEILMHGNGNGTLSALPQLGILEKYQKVNISLRNQILALETEAGRIAEPKQEDNPFN